MLSHRHKNSCRILSLNPLLLLKSAHINTNWNCQIQRKQTNKEQIVLRFYVTSIFHTWMFLPFFLSSSFQIQAAQSSAGFLRKQSKPWKIKHTFYTAWTNYTLQHKEEEHSILLSIKEIQFILSVAKTETWNHIGLWNSWVTVHAGKDGKCMRWSDHQQGTGW